jgi:hypothetical protein
MINYRSKIVGVQSRTECRPWNVRPEGEKTPHTRPGSLPRQSCPAVLPCSLAQQSCPAVLPGSLARQSCPAVLPGSLARQTCPAVLPGSLAQQSCPAVLPSSLAQRTSGNANLPVFYSSRHDYYSIIIMPLGLTYPTAPMQPFPG